ncbi:hypothetical protein GWA97_06560 [Flavobacterium sp. LaA7.5]|nr:hypothetical protein [Flavobacterium salilacus subsp. altitudinum]
MEQLNLPFRLGMDYEELEFDLEIMPDRIQGYDSYIYLGEFNNFLNYNTDRIELLFRMDVLEGIIISLPLKKSEDIAAQLENLSGNLNTIIQYNCKLYRFYNNSPVSCITLINNNNSYILISNNNLISPLFTSLLW